MELFSKEELTKRKKKTDYINNKSLYEAIIAYQDQVALALSEGKEQPIIPEYIGKAIWLLCNRLGYKKNFINYTWKDEMIDDAIDMCIAAVLKFKREITQNPFAYFTKIAYIAFISRIKEEKKQIYLKHKNFQNISTFSNGDAEIMENIESTNYIIEEFEKKVYNNEIKNKKST